MMYSKWTSMYSCMGEGYLAWTMSLQKLLFLDRAAKSNSWFLMPSPPNFDALQTVSQLFKWNFPRNGGKRRETREKIYKYLISFLVPYFNFRILRYIRLRRYFCGIPEYESIKTCLFIYKNKGNKLIVSINFFHCSHIFF